MQPAQVFVTVIAVIIVMMFLIHCLQTLFQLRANMDALLRKYEAHHKQALDDHYKLAELREEVMPRTSRIKRGKK